MGRLAGSLLDRAAFERSFSTLAAERAAEVARRFALDLERVRLLPAGLLILEAVSNLFGTALQLGCGGIREGVLLEAGGFA
jgi:exopolyphosphatase/guanosine-5'-triphosphate,3'-diphosphate pyrophosphatase